MMSERTALFLASLSHQWFGLALLLPVVFGAGSFAAGRLRKHARARRRNRIQVIAAIAQIVSAALFGVSLVLFATALMHLGCAALKAQGVQCQSNLKQVSLALLMYSEDNGDRMPPSADWAEAIAPRLPEAAKSTLSTGSNPFGCPAAESPASYGMNGALGGLPSSRIVAPADTVLLFDADAPRRSFAGGPGDIASTRHGGAPNVAFADGHVKFANAYVRARLNMAPAGIPAAPPPAPLHRKSGKR
jgi:prepilin-type processing-associated H-X9-DG protein